MTAALLGGLAVGVPASADATGFHRPDDGLTVQQTNLISDIPGKAALLDKDLVNPWEIVVKGVSPIWSPNAGNSTVTLYHATPGAGTAAKLPNVRITTPAPAGQVGYDGKGFLLTDGKVKTPSRFIFGTLTGSIGAWAQPVTPDIGAAQIKATVPGAVYTGLALASTPKGDRLYAANVAQNRVDVFDDKFQLLEQPTWAFHDPFVPKGFTPFNPELLNGKIFVTYHKTEPVADGKDLGYVSEFTADGLLIDHYAAKEFNDPWGLAIAPKSWGKIAGSLLVGNFGNGKVSVLKPSLFGHFQHHVYGQLKDAKGTPIVNDRLWTLTPGTATVSGTDAIVFSAGIEQETHGLIGTLHHVNH
ncbi:TIGR03118 family protein [Kribbella endophytica]